MKKDIDLITVLGWEERFIKGLEETIDKFLIKKIILIRFGDYLFMDNMQNNINRINELQLNHHFAIEYIDLNYNDSVENWNVLESFFCDIENTRKFLLNISTVPRETIWTLFFFLKKYVANVEYIYFKPRNYCKDWLTKNHKSPRLLFKHSGIFDLNKDLVLFVIAGFDNTRLDQIIEFYEPSKVVIFYQEGEQFNNHDRNKDFECYKNRGVEFCEIFSINTYNVEEATDVLLKKYDEYRDKHNVIIDSQGPKISALSVYNVYLKTDNKIGLAYVAAKDFNLNYSSGIDNHFISGNFKF